MEVASNLRILPGHVQPEVVLASRHLRPVSQAWNAEGRDVTDRVARRDDVYADGYRPSRYQGIAAEPWTFTLDLGEGAAKAKASGAGLRLHLDGWIFPADASLNLAVAQRGDLSWDPPRLEVERTPGAGDWEVLMPAMGFPAGKTKTMVVDTPPLPDGARRLRIITTQWLHWDRIAWTHTPADEEAHVVARLDPARADLRYRGFSRLVRRAPNAPHDFVYADATAESPWLPFPGSYTRYGAVGELLESVDSRSVILAPGDEIALEFDASHLPPPAPGHTRTVFLESVGWDKDADRNTWEARQMEPLPFHGMSGYPYGPGETFPETPALTDYRRTWLTRRVEAPPPAAALVSDPGPTPNALHGEGSGK